MATRLDSPELYTIGWIAALPIERAAATALLDDRHDTPKRFHQPRSDPNSYTWGRVGHHNIVIASLPAGVYGTTSAATTASSLLSSVPHIRFGLLVGIGGGIARPDHGRDIRLGDVVVSQPDGTHGGVVQYDLGKAKPSHIWERKGSLNMPPTALLNALANLQAEHGIMASKIPDLLQAMWKTSPRMKEAGNDFTYQGSEHDRLFGPKYDHVEGTTCDMCPASWEVKRCQRDTVDTKIHYGVIASGNTLVKDATTRDSISNVIGEQCLCVEMEAAGLMNHFPCLVIRGICDYADSHKNDRWQRYASATAAAFAVELLSFVPPQHVAIPPPTKRPDTPPSPLSTIIPFRRDPHFVPRDNFLQRIHQLCSEPAGRMALVGLGGVGKSQLAIEFAHQLEQTTPKGDQMRVFWVHAGTVVRVKESFQAIADAMKIPNRNQADTDIMQLVYSWLSNEAKGKWCMILDSADDHDVFFSIQGNVKDGRPLATYLPQSRNGSILVTTRNKDLAFKLTGDFRTITEVGPMADIEALQLLENRLGPLSDGSMAADLARALDFIPLAISQAAAYIQARMPRTSVAKYLAEFQESERKRVKLLGHEAGDLRRDGGASNAILTTWWLSFNHIRSRRVSAADLLSLMSFFNRQGIPEWLLKLSKGTVDAPQASLGASTDSESESGQSEIDSEFEDDVAVLREYYLVTAIEGEDAFEMHGLVQLSTRRWLEASDLEETFKEKYITLLAEYFPSGEYENWELCKMLYSHTEAAVEHRPKKGSVKEKWAGLLYNGAWYASEQGLYIIAERMLLKGRKAFEKQLGSGDEATLTSTSLLASTYRNQGRWEEAEKLEVQVLETHKTKLGPDHPFTLSSMANLASTLWKQGRWEEAEKLEVQVMETRKTKLGADHPSTLTSMANLAATYRNQGRWEEAEKLEVQVMETRTTKLGADHPDTLTSMANLAATYKNQGRWEEAEKLEVQVMETSKTKLGADHPSTLSSMANLASTLWRQGRWEEAEKLEVQVMETRKTKLGPDHPDTLTSMANLAATYRDQGRWEEAEKVEVQVMETRKTKLGPDHPSTLSSTANLASTLWRQGRWEEAEKLEVQVMETRKTKLGPNHPFTLTSMANLASTYRDQGRWEEAEKLEVQVMETRKTKLGPDHPDTLSSIGNLASTYRKQGRWEEAEKLFVQAMETSKTKLGPDHPSTLTSMANLALTLWNQGRWEEAEKLEVQVMETRKTKLGPGHPSTLTSMANLAFTWKTQGRHGDALALMVACAQAQRQVLGIEHPDTLSSSSTIRQWSV
ncbi:putative kinesin [Dactylonectria estremocensis]|uniref:Kinesin n=1 Tax=Dactylonectria estremocensis TaxID=1079267 RepID=A0A9P9D827_9HYPO|nr:putative kinesin [Dactylonectria estremocensis]